MATATTQAPVVQQPGVGQYRCECGHVLQMFGGGRHRVYFELADARLDDPVMNRVCPECERGLPGKNPTELPEALRIAAYGSSGVDQS